MKSENELKDPLLGELLRESEQHRIDLSETIMTQIFVEEHLVHQLTPKAVFPDNNRTLLYFLLGVSIFICILGGIIIAGSFILGSDIGSKYASGYYTVLEYLFLYGGPIFLVGIIFFMYDQVGDFLELKRLGLFKDGSMKAGK